MSIHTPTLVCARASLTSLSLQPERLRLSLSTTFFLTTPSPQPPNSFFVCSTQKKKKNRWCNQLNPSVKRGPFTEEEDRQILAAHAIHGNKWAVISRSISGRCETMHTRRPRDIFPHFLTPPALTFDSPFHSLTQLFRCCEP